MNGVPAPNLHRHAGVHLLVDEPALGEAAPEIVTANVLEILVAGLLSRPIGCPLDHRSDATLGEIYEWLGAIDVHRGLILMKVPLDGNWLARLEIDPPQYSESCSCGQGE